MRTHLANLATGLAELGVVCDLAAPPDSMIRQEGGLRATIAIPLRSNSHPLADLRCAIRLRDAARDVELIHGHGLRGGWMASLASALYKRPYLATLHNLRPERLSATSRAGVGWMLRRAAAVICVSEAVRHSYGSLLLPNVETISNGIDLALFEKTFDREGARARFGAGPLDLLIAAAGRLELEKGFETLVRAASAAESAAPSLKVVLAGEGTQFERLRELSRELGIAGQIRFPGRVEDVASFLRAADLAVVPSLAEGQGMVAIEAMAAGRAVVASDVGGLKETVVEGETGLLVPPGDSDALAAAIFRLLGDESERNLMGRRGKARAASLYSRTVMCQRTRALYERILGGTVY
jgi:glycosyltransferase involved in cell wall biosynthesis